MKRFLFGSVIIVIFFSSCEKKKGDFVVPCITRAPMKITVEVKNNVFVPSTVNSLPGDTIEWVWVEGFHTTTSTSVPSGANSWDADIDNQAPANNSFRYIITQNGTYSYVCTIHETMGMTGTIIVAEACN